MPSRYMADFETTPDKKDCRVWLWCLVDLSDYSKIQYGTSLASFFKAIRGGDKTIYFHNLKFDGQFILWYAMSVLKMKVTQEREPWAINTLISDAGLFYKIELIYSYKNKHAHKTVFLDSYKKLSFPVRDIARAYGLEESKGEIDYNKPRPVGYQPTPEELEYVTNDVIIVAKALNAQFAQGLDKMTQGSDALNFCKNMIGKRDWEYYFPVLSKEMDDSIRRAYKGGAVMVHPQRENIEVYNGHSFDKNSMYPWAMCKTQPVGVPIWFDGKYTYDERYPLYIQVLSTEFKVKDGFLPTIQLKNNPGYIQTEYLTQSKEQTRLVLTSVDLDLFFRHYEPYNIRYEGGFKFKTANGIFDDFIDYWYKVKAESTGARRSIAKLMLNSCYGKLASRTEVKSKIPYLENNIVKYEISQPKIKKPVYTAAAAFITSYGRESVITAAQALGGSRPDSHFCYMDTDSVHVCGVSIEDARKVIDIDSKRLGAWKHEYSFDRAKYLRQKCYIEEIAYRAGTMEYEKYVEKMTGLPIEEQKKARFELGKDAYYEYVKRCAGMSEEIKQMISYDEFDFDYSCPDLKLRPVNCPGGVVLEPAPFTIKRG